MIKFRKGQSVKGEDFGDCIYGKIHKCHVFVFYEIQCSNTGEFYLFHRDDIKLINNIQQVIQQRYV